MRNRPPHRRGSTTTPRPLRAFALAAATGAFLVPGIGAAHAAEVVPDPPARTPSVASTIGDVLDTVTDTVDDTLDTVDDTVDTVDGTVSDTVDTVDETVDGTVDGVRDAVDDATNPGGDEPPAPAPDPPAPGDPATGGGGHGSGGGNGSGGGPNPGPRAPSDVAGSGQLAATGGDGASIDTTQTGLDSGPAVTIRTPVVPADPADPGGFGSDTAHGRFAIGLLAAAIAVLVLFHAAALWLRIANEGPAGPFPPSGARSR
jgi:hypothetical protein